MTSQENHPPGENDARAGGKAEVSEKELKEWARSHAIYRRIAAALASQITDEGWQSWHPLPANAVFAQVWDCSPVTAGRAKRLLMAHGILVYEKRAYYVA